LRLAVSSVQDCGKISAFCNTPRGINIFKLKIELTNHRTVHQSDKLCATNALISIYQKLCWGLMENVFDDYYRPTKNTLVLQMNGENVVEKIIGEQIL
jgi:hypothetical protein